MTANELADALEIAKNKLIGQEYELGGRAIIIYTEAATMLRQQADEIEAGIELVKKFQEERDELKAECDRLYRIIELNETLK